jgi:hypothetical protein
MDFRRRKCQDKYTAYQAPAANPALVLECGRPVFNCWPCSEEDLRRQLVNGEKGVSEAHVIFDFVITFHELLNSNLPHCESKEMGASDRISRFDTGARWTWNGAGFCIVKTPHIFSTTGEEARGCDRCPKSPAWNRRISTSCHTCRRVRENGIGCHATSLLGVKTWFQERSITAAGRHSKDSRVNDDGRHKSLRYIVSQRQLSLATRKV